MKRLPGLAGEGTDGAGAGLIAFAERPTGMGFAAEPMLACDLGYLEPARPPHDAVQAGSEPCGKQPALHAAMSPKRAKQFGARDIEGAGKFVGAEIGTGQSLARYPGRAVAAQVFVVDGSAGFTA